MTRRFLTALALLAPCGCAGPALPAGSTPVEVPARAPVESADEGDVVYVALFRPSRNFPTGNPFEHPTFPEHATFMERLHAEGIVARGGPFADLSGALVEFLWDDPEEIDRILQEEPFVLEDVWTYEILAWVQSL